MTANMRAETTSNVPLTSYPYRLLQSCGMILIGIAVALLYWLFEAAMHSASLGEQGVRAGIAPHNTEELLTRLFVVFSLLLLSGLAQWALARRRHSQQRLLMQTLLLGERVKELNCLYSISKLMEDSTTPFEDALQNAVALIPESWRYPEIACARVTVRDKQYTTSNFRETRWRQIAEIHVAGRSAGTTELYYLEEPPGGKEVPFLEEEQALLGAVSELLGRMIERNEAREALRRARQKIEQLHDVAHQMGVLEGVDSVRRAAVQAAEEILSLSRCSLHIHDTDAQASLVTSAKPPWAENAGNGATPDSSTAPGQIEEADRCDSTSASSDTRGANSQPPLQQISLPVGPDLGTFRALCQKGSRSPTEDVRLLELLLGHTAEAIRRIRLVEQLREQALRDPLTGLHNRRYLQQMIDREMKRSKRHGHGIGFVVLDIDRLKDINDQHGHQVGDAVLQEVAALLLSQVRDVDTLIRMGGDEFLLVLPEADLALQTVRQRIIEEVARRNAARRDFDFPVTLSIGSAQWDPASDRSVEEVLSEADERMYASKRGEPEQPTSDSGTTERLRR